MGDRAAFLTRLRTSRMTSQDVKERKSQVLLESAAEDDTPAGSRRFDEFEVLHYKDKAKLDALWAARAVAFPEGAGLETVRGLLS